MFVGEAPPCQLSTVPFSNVSIWPATTAQAAHGAQKQTAQPIAARRLIMSALAPRSSKPNRTSLAHRDGVHRTEGGHVVSRGKRVVCYGARSRQRKGPRCQGRDGPGTCTDALGPE